MDDICVLMHKTSIICPQTIKSPELGMREMLSVIQWDADFILLLLFVNLAAK